MKCIDSSDKKLGGILNGNKQEAQKNELVVFKEDIEEFVGLEGEKMGPYDKGQIANISKEIAKILIDDGKVEVVEEWVGLKIIGELCFKLFPLITKTNKR